MRSTRNPLRVVVCRIASNDAETGLEFQHDWNKRIIDGISVLMKLESGATAIIESLWVLPESRGKSTARLEVTCTKGVAFVDDYDRKITVYDSQGVVYPDTIMKPNVWGKVTGVLKEELSLFLDCIINDETPIVSGEDALESIELALAVKQSSETGEIVKIN